MGGSEGATLAVVFDNGVASSFSPSTVPGVPRTRDSSLAFSTPSLACSGEEGVPTFWTVDAVESVGRSSCSAPFLFGSTPESAELLPFSTSLLSSSWPVLVASGIVFSGRKALWGRGREGFGGNLSLSWPVLVASGVVFSGRKALWGRGREGFGGNLSLKVVVLEGLDSEDSGRTRLTGRVAWVLRFLEDEASSTSQLSLTLLFRFLMVEALSKTWLDAWDPVLV